MALITWNAGYSVKIESIDKQHKVLVDMINEFYDNLKIKSNEVLIAGLIKKMKDYTILHFKTEENLFQKFGYPGSESHKKEHNDFINKVTDLEKKLQDGKMILSFEITNFLKDWLIKHIQGTDMRYSQFLQDKGVK